MEKINELKDFPSVVIDPETGKKIYRPSSESIEAWSKEVSELYQTFLQLQREGRLSK